MSSDKELIYWGNQHGHGITIQGELARKVQIAAARAGETPEEFVMKVIDKKFGEGNI